MTHYNEVLSIAIGVLLGGFPLPIFFGILRAVDHFWPAR